MVHFDVDGTQQKTEQQCRHRPLRHQKAIYRVENDKKKWLSTVSVGDSAAKKQLPIGLHEGHRSHRLT